MNKNLYIQLRARLYDIYWEYLYSKIYALIEEYVEEHPDYFLEIIEQNEKNIALFKRAGTMFHPYFSENKMGDFLKRRIEGALKSYIENLYFKEFFNNANTIIKVCIKEVSKQETEMGFLEKAFKKSIKALIERNIEEIQKEHEDGL